MHIPIILAILVISILTTLRRGPGGAFVYVFMPVLMFLEAMKPLQLPKLPDVYSTMAVSYGMIIGMIVGGKFVSIRLHFVDFLVLCCSITVIITGVINGEFWTLVSATGAELLRWLVPYYGARVAFREAGLRRALAIQLCYTAMVLAFMGLIEFRLWPDIFSRVGTSLGISNAMNGMAMGRGGFFRAMVTSEHPIDFGNMGLLLTGLVPMLAVVGGLRLRSWQVILGTLSSMAIVGESISFSSFVGLAVAIGIFFTLRYIRFSEWLLAPAVIGVIVFMFAFTANLLNVDLNAIRPSSDEPALAGSYYVRVLIIQNSWNSYGKQAGLLGFGDDNIQKSELQLESVDNSYMLFLMRRGWVHLILRLTLGVTIAVLGTLMLKKARTPAQRVPPAAAIAVLLGTMAAMYTVWFGFVYAVLWTMLLGMTVTMRQMIGGQVSNEASPAPLPNPAYGRGFEMLPGTGGMQPARIG